MADQLGGCVLQFLVEAGFGALGCGRKVEMVDDLLVVLVCETRTGPNRLFEPIGARRDRDVAITAEILHQDALQFGIALRKTPLDRAVDDVLLLGLAGVERLDRVDDVVAHDAGAVGGVAPVLRLKRAHRAAVPLARRHRGTSPVAVARVKNVVLEVFEDVVGRLCAFKVGRVVMQKEVVPKFGVLALQMRERVDGQTVVVRTADGILHQAEKQTHETAPRIKGLMLVWAG